MLPPPSPHPLPSLPLLLFALFALASGPSLSELTLHHSHFHHRPHPHPRTHDLRSTSVSYPGLHSGDFLDGATHPKDILVTIYCDRGLDHSAITDLQLQRDLCFGRLKDGRSTAFRV